MPLGLEYPVSSTLSWQRMKFDGLGRRTIEERIQLPTAAGLTENARTMTYNAFGWKLTESMWGSSKVTTFGNYDRFGRVGTVTPPGQQPVRFSYQGER